MRVRQILATKANEGVITVTPTTSIKDVLTVLADNRIGGVVVSASGLSADGILSERDIVRALQARGAAVVDEQARDLMTPDPVCASPDDSAVAILQRMTEGRFRHMPVLQGDNLVGIVTIGDVVKSRMDELSEAHDAMHEMILGGAS